MNDVTLKKATGIVATFTPFGILFAGLFSSCRNNLNWWHSLSASYYNIPTMAVFTSCFFLLAVLLILNKGILTKIVGILLFLIVIFPCADKTIPITQKYIGVLHLDLELSNTIHSLASFGALVCMAIEIIYFLYAYENKKVYLISILCIALATALIVIENICHNQGNWSLHWTTIITETTLFVSFGHSYYFNGSDVKKR